MSADERILIVTFGLEGLEPSAYRAHCEAVAPRFAALPGLRSKAWLADPESGTYGGVYAWSSRHAMHAYLDGPLFAGLEAMPGITGVSARDFGLLAGPTRITDPARGGAPSAGRLPPLAPRDSWAA